MITQLKHWLPAAIAATVLTLVAAVGGISLAVPAGVADYQARIKAAVQGVDYRVREWIGFDVMPTPAAQNLLRPNVLFQRQYTRENRDLALLIVHCGDVRDMQGHYPPICYPAHGWTLRERTDRTIHAAGMTIPARDYVFERTQNGRTDELRVTQFFVLPGSRTTHRDIDAIRAASRSPTAAGLGAGQVQLITADDVPADAWTSTLSTFITEIKPVLLAIGDRTNAH